jgi:hypothetical protein
MFMPGDRGRMRTMRLLPFAAAGRGRLTGLGRYSVALDPPTLYMTFKCQRGVRWALSGLFREPREKAQLSDCSPSEDRRGSQLGYSDSRDRLLIS